MLYYPKIEGRRNPVKEDKIELLAGEAVPKTGAGVAEIAVKCVLETKNDERDPFVLRSALLIPFSATVAVFRS